MRRIAGRAAARVVVMAGGPLPRRSGGAGLGPAGRAADGGGGRSGAGGGGGGGGGGAGRGGWGGGGGRKGERGREGRGRGGGGDRRSIGVGAPGLLWRMRAWPGMAARARTEWGKEADAMS